MVTGRVDRGPRRADGRRAPRHRHADAAATRRSRTSLGVPHLVVAVNKMDLVGYDRARFDEIVATFRAFAARSGIGTARFVPMSASSGDMVVERGDRLGWYDGPTLLGLLETVDVESALDRAPLRFPVQLVQRASPHGRRRYLGRIEAGAVHVGDRVAVLPSGRETRVRAIHTYDAPLDRRRLHASIALELDDELDVSRGDLIVRAGEAPAVVSRIAADVAWLADTPLDSRRGTSFAHATREVRARVESLAWRWDVETQTREVHPSTLEANGIGRVALTLGAPIADRRLPRDPADRRVPAHRRDDARDRRRRDGARMTWRC
jgi:sulfate adenylyltransferase subunit 1